MAPILHIYWNVDQSLPICYIYFISQIFIQCKIILSEWNYWCERSHLLWKQFESLTEWCTSSAYFLNKIICHECQNRFTEVNCGCQTNGSLDFISGCFNRCTQNTIPCIGRLSTSVICERDVWYHVRRSSIWGEAETENYVWQWQETMGAPMLLPTLSTLQMGGVRG